MQEYSVGKSTMERYNIRLNGGNHWRCAWAIISISPDGVFNAQTDCGDFSYRWGSFGDSFKSFLLEICSKDTSYLYRKISDHEREGKIDMEKTIDNMKSRILQKRREDGNRKPYLRDELSPEEARELWDALDLLEHSEISNDAFASIFYHDLPSDERRKVFSDEFWYDDLLVTLPDRKATAFCEVVAPIFAEILKKELEEAQAVIA
ncbi:hypothetical protein [Paenibacillus rhizolycopersici]|uniref:hypothetical protein n=1 Tax=Paenibacillus rhizolycopersici TaxID=2780073 RepID=UPI003D2C7E18